MLNEASKPQCMPILLGLKTILALNLRHSLRFYRLAKHENICLHTGNEQKSFLFFIPQVGE